MGQRPTAAPAQQLTAPALGSQALGLSLGSTPSAPRRETVGPLRLCGLVSQFPTINLCVRVHTHAQTHTHTHACTHTDTHMRTHTRAHTRTHGHACTHTQTHKHTCTHAHTRAQTYRHTHACMHTGTHTHACTQAHACTCIHVHACTHAHRHTNTHAPTHTHMHRHTRTCMHTQRRICVHTCTHMHTRVHARAHIHVHTRMRAHTFTHAHTHTNTHARAHTVSAPCHWVMSAPPSSPSSDERSEAGTHLGVNDTRVWSPRPALSCASDPLKGTSEQHPRTQAVKGFKPGSRAPVSALDGSCVHPQGCVQPRAGSHPQGAPVDSHTHRKYVHFRATAAPSLPTW